MADWFLMVLTDGDDQLSGRDVVARREFDVEFFHFKLLGQLVGPRHAITPTHGSILLLIHGLARSCGTGRIVDNTPAVRHFAEDEGIEPVRRLSIRHGQLPCAANERRVWRQHFHLQIAEGELAHLLPRTFIRLAVAFEGLAPATGLGATGEEGEVLRHPVAAHKSIDIALVPGNNLGIKHSPDGSLARCVVTFGVNGGGGEGRGIRDNRLERRTVATGDWHLFVSVGFDHDRDLFLRRVRGARTVIGKESPSAFTGDKTASLEAFEDGFSRFLGDGPCFLAKDLYEALSVVANDSGSFDPERVGGTSAG